MFRLLAICILFSSFVSVLFSAPVEIWISSQQDLTYYQNMVNLYKEKVDKKFQANVHAYGFREMPDKLHTAMKTGKNTPDIVQLDEIFFGMYLRDQLPFVDLTEKVKKAGLDKKILKPRLDLFSHKGKIYGLPQSVSAIVLYYREDLFDRYEISPSDIDTWDNFVKVMGKLAKEKGQGSLALDWSYLDILVRQRGSDFFDKNGKPNLKNEVVIDTFNWLAKLNKEGIGVLPDRGSIFDPVFFSGDIANEEVFCILGAAWYGLDMIQQFAPDMKGKWRAMPLPQWTDKLSKGRRSTSSFAGQGLMVYKDSKNIDASWGFMKFVMENKEANIKRFADGNSFPAYMPIWKDPALMKANEYFGQQSLGALMVSLAGDVPHVNTNPARAQLIFMLRENFFSAVINGVMTAEEAMKEIENRFAQYQKGPPKKGKPDEEKKK